MNRPSADDAVHVPIVDWQLQDASQGTTHIGHGAMATAGGAVVEVLANAASSQHIGILLLEVLGRQKDIYNSHSVVFIIPMVIGVKGSTSEGYPSACTCSRVTLDLEGEKECML